MLPCHAFVHSTHCLRLWRSESSLLCFRQPEGLARTAVELVSVLCRVSSKHLWISLHHASCPRPTDSPTTVLISQTICSGCFFSKRPSKPLQGSGKHPTHTLRVLAAGIWGQLSGHGGEGSPRLMGDVGRGSLRCCGETATSARRSCFHISLCHLAPARPTVPAALQCLAMVLTEKDPQAHIPAQTCPIPVPKDVPNAQGWGCPGATQPPCSWLGQRDGPWLSGPALMDPGSLQNSWATGSSQLLQHPSKV